MATDEYKLVQLRNGAHAVYVASYDEKMHPGLGPAAEAEALYVRQLKVRERMQQHAGEFVVWDVGLGAAANALAQTPLGGMDIGALNRWRVRVPAPAATPAIAPLLAGRIVAVARDQAFCFIYPANLDTLRALSAKLVFFSPLADAGLPACDALWLPGGYPELHAAAIAGNAGMRSSIAAHVAAGRPIWAECGGMMALFEQLATSDGEVYPCWGVLPGRVTMHKHLAALGPQQLQLAAGVLRGHTFHYSTCATPLSPVARTARPDASPAAAAGEAFYRRGPVRASYFHAWFASCPQAAASLFLAGAAA